MKLDLIVPCQYEFMSQAEQEAMCQEILAEIKDGRFKSVGESNRSHWEEVWSQHDSLIPPFVRPTGILRWKQRFFRSAEVPVEEIWYRVFRQQVLGTYFQFIGTLYEFGCGNGWNLVAASEIHPRIELLGLDFSHAAVARLQAPIQGRVFDFFQPDYGLKLKRWSGVLTVGALEQTGKDWGPFLEYLLANKPHVCVHVEPILEWYDPKNPVDATAIEYHRARKYWEGFPARMEELARQGKVEILEKQRSYFGSRYIEGYSLFVWKPL